MIETSILNEITDRLVKTYHPKQIYLFGSYAWGNPTPDSDLDILVVVGESNEKIYKRPRSGAKALMGIGASTDLLVYTKKEFEEKAGKISTLSYKIKTEGKTLYDAS